MEIRSIYIWALRIRFSRMINSRLILFVRKSLIVNILFVYLLCFLGSNLIFAFSPRNAYIYYESESYPSFIDVEADLPSVEITTDALFFSGEEYRFRIGNVLVLEIFLEGKEPLKLELERFTNVELLIQSNGILPDNFALPTPSCFVVYTGPRNQINYHDSTHYLQETPIEQNVTRYHLYSPGIEFRSAPFRYRQTNNRWDRRTECRLVSNGQRDLLIETAPIITMEKIKIGGAQLVVDDKTYEFDAVSAYSLGDERDIYLYCKDQNMMVGGYGDINLSLISIRRGIVSGMGAISFSTSSTPMVYNLLDQNFEFESAAKKEDFSNLKLMLNSNDGTLILNGTVDDARISNYNLFPNFSIWFTENINLIALNWGISIIGGIIIKRKNE